jgi:acetylglutamate kinase
MEEIIKKADVLIEALPYIQRFNKKIAVIKYGGAVMEDDLKRLSTLENIVFMSYVGIKPVLVHGGSPFINKKIQELGRTPQFIDGHRVTDENTAVLVNETLSRLNRKIVSEIRKLGAEAVGLSGKNEGMIKLKERKSSRKKRLGYVGEIESINPNSIKKVLAENKIPVIFPVTLDKKQQLFNLNADQASSQIAVALKAEKLVLLTNIKGIMRDENEEDSLISTLTVKEVKDLIKRNIIKGGMLPKVKACIDALRGGIKKTHIIDGRIPHSLLLEIFTDKGIGTEIIKTTRIRDKVNLS